MSPMHAYVGNRTYVCVYACVDARTERGTLMARDASYPTSFHLIDSPTALHHYPTHGMPADAVKRLYIVG